MARLPTIGGDNNSWGTVLSDFLQQSLNSDGTLVTVATNPYTGIANTNLATASKPGLVQLAGDLGGTATSPALASVVTAGSVGSTTAIPVITYDAKGRITAATTAIPATATSSSQGTIQLAGDLTGSATSPALANVVTAGTVGAANTVPIITYDAKGRITTVATAANPSLKLNSTFTTTAITATATNLSFAVAANEIWSIEFFANAQCSSTTGSAYQVSAPTGATIEGTLESTTSTASTLLYQRITAINTLTATAVHTVATTPAPDRISATIVNGSTAGTIAIAVASKVATVTTTIFAGASLKAQKLTGV